MKLNELYAFTVVGLRKWPDGKGRQQHSAQELIVTKDPIKHPIRPMRPKKRKPMFAGVPDFASTPKDSKAIGAKWSPMVSPAVAESIKAEYDAGRIDAYDVANLVMDIAVKAAKESMKHKQRKHERVYDEDEPFKHTAEAYVDDAEEFVQSVIGRLNDTAWSSLKEKVKEEYPELPSEIEHRRAERQKKMEKE